jgi:hypothetical protein
VAQFIADLGKSMTILAKNLHSLSPSGKESLFIALVVLKRLIAALSGALRHSVRKISEGE